MVYDVSIIGSAGRFKRSDLCKAGKPVSYSDRKRI